MVREPTVQELVHIGTQGDVGIERHGAEPELHGPREVMPPLPPQMVHMFRANVPAVQGRIHSRVDAVAHPAAVTASHRTRRRTREQTGARHLRASNSKCAAIHAQLRKVQYEIVHVVRVARIGDDQNDVALARSGHVRTSGQRRGEVGLELEVHERKVTCEKVSYPNTTRVNSRPATEKVSSGSRRRTRERPQRHEALPRSGRVARCGLKD